MQPRDQPLLLLLLQLLQLPLPLLVDLPSLRQSPTPQNQRGRTVTIPFCFLLGSGMIVNQLSLMAR